MLIKEKLETFAFSPAETVVVDYLLTAPEALDQLSIQEIAAQTYTQPSTLVRIAKKLHFDGWKSFKKHYLEECRYLNKHFTRIDPNLPFSSTDSLMTICKKMAVLDKMTIDDIFFLLDHDHLSQAKSLLLKANHIQIFSQNSNLLIAQDFALKMNRIQKNVTLSAVRGEENYDAYNLSPDACAILISYSGENPNLLALNTILRARNIPTIAITSIGENRLSQECTCFLPITTREKLYSKICNFTINTSIIFLLNVLYALVFSEHYDAHLKHLKRIGELVDHRTISNAVMQENERTKKAPS